MASKLKRLDPVKREIRVLSFDEDRLATARERDQGTWLACENSKRWEIMPEIHCRLSTINLDSTDSKDSYSALSYVWGSQEPETYISINGHHVAMVPNLISALRHVRQHPQMKGRKLWIDAICINQADLNEKASQVDMMGEIYRRANEVFIWLGEEGEESNLAMDLLDSVPFNEGEKAMQAFLDKTADYAASWRALKRLFERDYWKRVWVLQEVLLSQKAYVLCGDRVCSWEAVMALLKRSNYVDKFRIVSRPARLAILDIKLLPLPLINAVNNRREGQMGLLEYLVLSRQRRATMAHDYIYGVMGLIDDQVILADYNKTVEEVYHEVTIYMLKEKKDLGILSMCCENVGQKALPTWVPDWQNEFQEDYQSFLLCHRNYDTGFASKHIADPGISKDGRILQLEGIFIDTVSFISPEEPIQNRWVQVGADWTAWLVEATSKSDQYGSFEGQREAFRCTLYCQHGIKAYKYDGSDQYFDIAVSESVIRPTRDKLTHSSRSFGTAGRRFFGTNRGYMGRGLYSIEKGDIVVAFKGAKVPFILRKSKQDGFHSLVGECYLHGVMNGEFCKDSHDWIKFYLE